MQITQLTNQALARRYLSILFLFSHFAQEVNSCIETQCTAFEGIVCIGRRLDSVSLASMVHVHGFRHSASEPFRADDTFERASGQTTSPFPSFLSPTRSRYHHVPSTTPEKTDHTPPSSSHSPAQGSANGSNGSSEAQLGRAPAIAFHWRSRDNRKGRHTLLVDPAAAAASKHPFDLPRPTTHWRSVVRTLLAMCTTFPVWDISYLVAVLFTLGSAVWVINAFFVWLPLVRPATEFPDEVLVGGGWTAFVGATIFEVGSVFLLLEAVNEDRAGCFGWALEQAWSHPADGADAGADAGVAMQLRPSREACSHHHSNRHNFLGRGNLLLSHSKPESSTDRHFHDADPLSRDRRTWQWCPTLRELRTHYLHSLGFLASAAQLLAATVFWISGFTAIPQVAAQLTTPAALDLGFWVPQVVGGCGFIVSGVLFMLETQNTWWRPAPATLGWWIGAWNVVGAVGFMLCGALGPAASGGDEGAGFQSNLATFWGGWAFLVGSVVQWYESLQKHPVEEVRLGDRVSGRHEKSESGLETHVESAGSSETS